MSRGGEHRRRDLVQQRLELVVVVLVDERDVDVVVLRELPGAGDAGEPAADDRRRGSGLRCVCGHRPVLARASRRAAAAPVRRPGPGRARRRRSVPSGRGCRAARGGRSTRAAPGRRPGGRRSARGRASSAAAAAARRSTTPAGCRRSGTGPGTSSPTGRSRRRPRAAGRRTRSAASRMPDAIRAASSLKP